jgi:hypothetical protein
LFGAITKVGRCSRSMSQAVVADLPVPVAPSNTLSFAPARMRSVNASMADGWSPDGANSETTSNLPAVGSTSSRPARVLMQPPYGPGPTPRPGRARARGRDSDDDKHAEQNQPDHAVDESGRPPHGTRFPA